MTTYSDSTLKRMKKEELIDLVRRLEHNLQGEQKRADYGQFQLEQLVEIYGVSTNVLLEIQTRYIKREL